jgi:hypothetical protein
MGERISFQGGQSELFIKPQSIIGESFFIWAQECQSKVIEDCASRNQ